MKGGSLRTGGLPLPMSFLILATSTRFLAHNFRKDWSTCALKNFCHSSYIFEIITHFLADKLFLIWHSNTPLNTTPEGWMVYSIVYSPLKNIFNHILSEENPTDAIFGGKICSSKQPI